MQNMSIESEGEGRGGGEDIEIIVEEYSTTKENQTKRRAWGIFLLLIVVIFFIGIGGTIHSILCLCFILTEKIKRCKF